jgi:hypothetical protein
VGDPGVRVLRPRGGREGVGNNGGGGGDTGWGVRGGGSLLGTSGFTVDMGTPTCVLILNARPLPQAPSPNPFILSLHHWLQRWGAASPPPQPAIVGCLPSPHGVPLLKLGHPDRLSPAPPDCPQYPVPAAAGWGPPLSPARTPKTGIWGWGGGGVAHVGDPPLCMWGEPPQLFPTDENKWR